jgi:hypothetical protein
MIYVAHACPTVAGIGPGNPRARINGQRERVEGTAAARDRDVGGSDWVATGLWAWAWRWARGLGDRLQRARAEKQCAEDKDYPVTQKGSFCQRLSRSGCVILIENCRHNFFRFVVAGREIE